MFDSWDDKNKKDNKNTNQNDMIEDVVNEYADAFKSMFTGSTGSNKGSRYSGHGREPKEPYAFNDLNMIGVSLYRVFRYSRIHFKDDKYKDLKCIANELLKCSIFVIGMFIVLVILKLFIPQNNVALKGLIDSYYTISLITSIGILLVLKIYARTSFKAYMGHMFYSQRIVNTYRRVPEFLYYVIDRRKYEYSRLLGRDSKSYNRIYYFKSTLVLSDWERFKENIELILNTNVLNIKQGKTRMYVEIVTNKELPLEVEVIDKIDYKDESLSLDVRVKRVFQVLDLKMNNLNSMYDGRFGTVMYFNSQEQFLKIQAALTEIRHRLKINNLLIETSDIPEYEYLIKIIKKVDKVSFLDAYEEVKESLNDMVLPIILGLNPQGLIKVVDYVSRYNTIIGGTIRSGKTNQMKNLLSMLLLAEKNVSIVLIDPKKDCRMFSDIDNVYYVSCENSDDEMIETIKVLNWCVKEMERRNNMFAEIDFCDNIEKYNKYTNSNLPYLFVIIEELADLVLQSNDIYVEAIEKMIQRLTQRAPSAGIKVILSTQKPSKDVIGKFVKPNCPNRAAFAVADRIESRVILDNSSEAANIKQKGTYIFKDGNEMEYYKAVFMNDLEFKKVITTIKDRQKLIKAN